MTRKTTVFVLALLAVAGCTLNKTELRRNELQTRVGGPGEVIAPKRCNVTVVMLARPLRDDLIDNALWRVADEQAVEPDVHRALEVNGLRIGLISGDLPAEITALLKAPPPHRVEPMEFLLPDGDSSLISLAETTPVVSLLLNQEGRAFGKDFQDASGWVRVTASHQGETAVKLRFVPEIHHGPIQRAFGAAPTGGSYGPHEFMRKDGQKEDALRDLATTIELLPNQVIVIGCRAEVNRSLGSFLFTKTEPNSDRLLQKVVLLWATRALPGSEGTVPRVLEPVDPPKP
jgi:hypothetical protein